MKSTDQFKKVIQEKLTEIAGKDQLFAECFQKKNKNIDDCIKYILNTVKKSGVSAFSDDEVYAMAMHYYDEDDIKIGGAVNCKVVSNHSIELSEEEKKKAKQEAFDLEVEKQRSKMQTSKPSKKKATTEDQPKQSLLF